MSVTAERGADRATRLDKAASAEEIRQLIFTYAQGFDRHDLDRFLSVWADDAVWSPGPGVEVSGLDNIGQTAQAMWNDLPVTHHWCSNAVIDVDGDAASAVVDLHAIANAKAGGWSQTAATYRDTFRRVDGSWRLARRETDVKQSFVLPDPVS